MSELFHVTSTCKSGGYRYCRTVPQHPNANSLGLYPLHRVLMENKLGRLLLASEVVHHIDENKDNNDLSNLQVMSASDHVKHHRQIRPRVEPVRIVCKCGRVFYLTRTEYRKRLRKTLSPISCSKSCGNRAGHLLRK